MIGEPENERKPVSLGGWFAAAFLGFVILFFIMGFAGLLDENPQNDLRPDNPSGQDVSADVSEWQDDFIAKADECDELVSAFSATLENLVESQPSIERAITAGEQAGSTCREISTEFQSWPVPVSWPEEIAVQADTARDKCRMAYFMKARSAESAAQALSELDMARFDRLPTLLNSAQELGAECQMELQNLTSMSGGSLK